MPVARTDIDGRRRSWVGDRGEPGLKLVEIPENPIPAGAVVEMLGKGSLDIRAARWPAPTGNGAENTGRGTVVLCPGRGEYIEKYAEVVGDLLARGFCVVAFDWRGQGGSSRLLRDARKGHVRRFGDYQDDLATVTARVVEPYCPTPWFALGHSMGAAILIDHASRSSCRFDRIVLSAPMMGLHGLRVPGAVRVLAAAATRLGFGSAFVPRGARHSVMLQPFEGNLLTSDPGRYATFSALTQAAPHLTIGAPTYGWLHAAFQLIGRFEDFDYARKVAAPVLIVGCGADRVVETPAMERFVVRLKTAALVVVPEARHEIMMERDAFRDQFWTAFDAFVPGSSIPLATATP